MDKPSVLLGKGKGGTVTPACLKDMRSIFTFGDFRSHKVYSSSERPFCCPVKVKKVDKIQCLMIILGK